MWSMVPVVARYGQTSLDNHQFLFWSSLVSFLGLFLLTWIRGEIKLVAAFSLKEWAWIAWLGFLGSYVYYLFLYLGYAQAAGMEVLVFQYTWPLFIALFSLLILREKLTLRKSLALLLGFVGVLLVVTGGDFASVNLSNPGVIVLVALGAASFALFSVLSKFIHRSPMPVVTLYFLTATLASLVSMLIFSDFALPARSEIPSIALNGLLVNGYSYIFWQIALNLSEASYLAPFTFITPILSAVLLVVFLGEPFLPVYALALICIIGGGLLNSLGKKQQRT
jgi:drug/metabolite transporter (DMT)-like permease